MFAVIATIFVKPGMAAEFVEAFRERRRRVLATEPDVLQYDLHLDATRPLEFVVIERFTSRQAHEHHLSSSRDHHRMMACFAAPPATRLLDSVPGCS
jgi:quinol monooxygenase YgiN